MDKYEIAITVIIGLTLFILSMNLKLVPKNKVLVIERLGRYLKTLDQPGIYFIIPLIDRVYQSVSLDEEIHHFKINDKDEIIHITYTYKVFDVKLFVYGEFDTLRKIDEEIESAYKSFEHHHHIDIEAMITFGQERGVTIRNITKDN
jgi:regulator of protease activity HflC (stomatin/prohibitin superfamily)